MLIKFVFLLYSLLTFSILADSVILNNRDNFKNITPKTKILKKSERNIDIIRKPEVEINFKKINSTSLNLGIIQGEFWLKYEIKNNSNNPDWIFEFDHPHIEKIEFYEFNKNNLINNLSTGNKFPLSSKIIPSKNFLFPVIIPKGKERTYYIFIKARTSLIINLYIWQKNKYITQVSKENFLYGIYLGIMMVMALYNLFLFLSIKESTYLYYILYILCFTTM
ncbi:MAG: hypothetical protein KDK36_17580, partial [Leptospiraceae bacterium]|nr:hypothetical protein [Leptospiraceae bacterium]